MPFTRRLEHCKACSQIIPDSYTDSDERRSGEEKNQGPAPAGIVPAFSAHLILRLSGTRETSSTDTTEPRERNPQLLISTLMFLWT